MQRVYRFDYAEPVKGEGDPRIQLCTQIREAILGSKDPILVLTNPCPQGALPVQVFLTSVVSLISIDKLIAELHGEYKFTAREAALVTRSVLVMALHPVVVREDPTMERIERWL